MAKQTTSGLTDWSKKTHAETANKVLAALKRMEAVIQENNGVYPGRLSVSEICREAGVSRATLEKPTHKLSTLPIVVTWLDKIRKRYANSLATSVDSADSKGRAYVYKARLEAVCQQYHEAELEMVALRDEVELLRSQLLSSNVDSNTVIAIKGRR